MKVIVEQPQSGSGSVNYLLSHIFMVKFPLNKILTETVCQ